MVIVWLYSIITRFLQLVRYNADYGKTRVDLKGENDKDKHNFGDLIDKRCVNNLAGNNHHDRAYVLYKQCIKKLFQFSADNPDLSTLHFPKWIRRYSAKDYPHGLIHLIFSAFEKECRADQKTYENVDDAPIASMRQNIIAEIDRIGVFLVV